MSLLSCLLCWCHSLAYDNIITTSDIMFIFKVNIKGEGGTSYALTFSLERENISQEASIHLIECLMVSLTVREIGAE